METKTNGRSLPKGWQWVKLRNISTIVRGSSPRPKGDPRYYGGKVPRLMVADITRDGMFVTPKIDFLTEEGALLSRPMKKGDVVMVVSGDPGTPAILAVDCCIHDGIVGFKDIDQSKINNSYLYYALKYIKAESNAQATGAIFRNLTTDQISNFEVNIPPLDEQRRIVSRLNEQLAAVESARKVAEEQLRAANALRAGYIRQFVEDQVFQKWSSVKLGELLVETRNGLYKPDKFYGQGKRILKMYNIGRLDGTWNLKRVDLIDLTDKEYDDYRLEVGDILLNRVNSRELVGKSAVINEKTEGAVFESKNIRVRVDNTRVLSDFVATYTNSKFGRVQFERKLKQIVGQATINRSDLDSFEIPLPPYNVQQKIISELKSKQIEIDNLEYALESQLAEIESLPASLLREAFAGQW